MFLESCINSLEASVELLDSSTEVLSRATTSFPKLSTILKTNRVFGLIPEADVLQSKKTLRHSVEPNIVLLLNRLDHELVKLERKRNSLIRKCELNKIRLENVSSLRKKRLSSGIPSRLELLRSKRRQLEYQVQERNSLQENKHTEEIRED
ncbi:DASH complex subunit [Komagataella phaffii CBS 7435]|uniref:DASH complex subunit SPC19 n=2 Tax=Komagataella phaffii TaxID=460519 RepID=C4R4E9_KOMPG|nr:Hypothetical protein PAS_chr3_0389 [Komagataella phaffii GS115]AOA63674.1 GQ67_03455T0 [Komagataella phaffii]CAH2449810.1 DASH complex subunit [Komagataella phaffii CBS 7435]AOA68546.1 GQ68_03425T0 [Komagataella phaffii GS115]CAY70435.1 Hypothetical protein PAS_chr3_0389 [Komagataella phaffii GS115]CCA39777.1 DASH complex subunit [Komagataella phaffii CBS 7435]